MINDKGLSLNNLIIGLRPKERESKVEGRFFALMSWNLRLYFVVTEYLIKRDFLDLFLGITMKDSLHKVQKKIINASQGQASESHWCSTNHIDYEKWNNQQRFESCHGEVLRASPPFRKDPSVLSGVLCLFRGRSGPAGLERREDS
jgi:hypothetical protein